MQKDYQKELEASLCISPAPAILVLALPALLLALCAFALPNANLALLCSIGIYALIPILWGIDRFHPQITVYLIVAAYVATIGLSTFITALPSLWLLCCMVTVVAAALKGRMAAIYAGSLVEIGLGLLWGLGSLSWQLAVIGLAMNAGLLATIISLLNPIHTLAYWAYDRYDRAQVLLDEARDRQAELKQAIDALAHANRELTLAHDRVSALRLVAEDAQRTKATFVSNVSHEFRAPLNIIIGLAEILLDARQVYGTELPPETQEDVAILYRNCQHLHDLVNDVLDLSQIEAGQLALQREWVDLGEILSGAIQIVGPLAEAKGLTLELDVAPNLRAHCDPRRIRQVILNLVSNAARFTDEGGITITAREDSDEVLVSVRDTGPGINVDDVERIFEPFQQSATAGAVLGKGSGLGLAISREFVQMHNGHIWVETNPGQGSTFSFRLPIEPPAELVSTAQRWLTPSWYDHVRTTHVPTGTLGDRVVVYDDTGRMTGVAERYAGEMELIKVPERTEIVETCSKASARAVLLCSEDKQVLLSDVQTLAQQLQGTPVVGMALSATLTRGDLGGAWEYITKPVSAESLTQAFAALPHTPHSFLIVDDEADSRHVLGSQLRRLDKTCEIKESASGREALALLQTWQPDVILLDVIMPEADGWQVLFTLQAEPALATVPTIMVSAQDRYAQPLTGSLLLASIHGGMNLNKLLASFRALNDVLLPHSGAPAAKQREKPPD